MIRKYTPTFQSKKSFNQFYIKEKILKLLNMKNTGYENRRKILKHRASRYFLENDEYVNMYYLDMSKTGASGALYTTIEDMYLLDQALYSKQLLKATTIEKMYTPAKQKDGLMIDVGGGLHASYGCKVGQYNGLKAIVNSGDINKTLSATYLRFIDQSFMVFIASISPRMASGSPRTTERIAFQISEVYLSKVK